MFVLPAGSSAVPVRAEQHRRRRRGWDTRERWAGLIIDEICGSEMTRVGGTRRHK